MTDSNEILENMENETVNQLETTELSYVENQDLTDTQEVPVDNKETPENVNVLEVGDAAKEEPASESPKETVIEKNDSSAFIRTLLTSSECPKNSLEVFEKLKSEDHQVVPQVEILTETCSQNIEQSNVIPKTFDEENVDNNEKIIKSEEMCVVTNSQEGKEVASNPVIKKIMALPDGFTDSSHSSSSELQSSAAPFESSCSSLENNFNAGRYNFENAIESSEVWRNTDDPVPKEASIPLPSVIALPSGESEKPPPVSEVPVVTTDSTVSQPPAETTEGCSETLPFGTSGFPQTLPGTEEKPSVVENQSEVKTETEPVQQPAVPPVPILPPAPRKRGRPRKQVLPNPSPLVESWGPGAQEFPTIETPTNKEVKRSARAERRQAKKKKFEESASKQDGDDDSSKKRFIPKPPVKKKKRRSTYTPKKRGPPPKKKHSEMENIQNFEEETRMSASEGHGVFSSKSGATGDESQGSSMTTEGHTRSNINKKGRMEVVTDSCKPVTVQQIVEYYWPPPSSLPHGEKPEGLMIQEQITEYLGVKSFKRKYPSIKRRPVDMEERNYLQENGFVSENMCDMGLTAVFASDIIEIMYNDFPNKFEEYRKYTREKKAKEQRALREKQAAERADMDPKKEAVESALSWNSEFNKTRSEEDYKLALYLKKQERKKLLTMRVQKLFENFLKHVPLSTPSKGLAYGGVIQLLAPDVVSYPPGTPKTADGLVLAVTFDQNDVENTQCIIDDLFIVGSSVRNKCARNTFIIESAEGKAEGEAVCYGDIFTLRSSERTEFPLYVDLPVPSLGAATGKCGLPNPRLSLTRGFDSRFKILHVRPDMKTSTSPCSPFERVVILHAPNNTALCVENTYWKTTLFGFECEISANTKLDAFKKYLPPNLWMFLVGSVN